MAVGTPHSGPASAGRPRQALGVLARPLGGARDERADVVGAREVVLDELERGDLALADEVTLLEGGQVVECGHAGDRTPRPSGQAAASSR